MPWGQVFSLMRSMDAPLKVCQENPSCHIAGVGGTPYRVFTRWGEQGLSQHPRLASPEMGGKGQVAWALLQPGLRWPLGLSHRHPAARHPQSSARACPVPQERCA